MGALWSYRSARSLAGYHRFSAGKSDWLFGTTWAADMVPQYRVERERGTKESRRQLAVLRSKWPRAFPVDHQDIRPLTIGAADEIAAGMGGSYPYTLGVLRHWKRA